MGWDSAWERVFKKQEWGKYPPESLIRFIARNFYQRDRKNTKILEIGCGPGANIWYLAREGFDTYGIDGSPTAIKKAKQRLQGEGLKATLDVADVEIIGYPDNYFDCIIDCECLAFNSEKSVKNILAQIKRVLKKNGLFYSKTCTNKMYIGRSQTKLGNLEFNNISDGPNSGKGFIRLTTRSKIRELYAKLFRVLSIDKIEYTDNNGSFKASEWIIICKNDK